MSSVRKYVEEVTVEDVMIDVCKEGCGGIWSDQFEINKFAEPHEFARQTLVDVDRDDIIIHLRIVPNTA